MTPPSGLCRPHRAGQGRGGGVRGLLPHPPTQATCGGRGTGGRVLGGRCPSDAHSRSQPFAADATALGAGSLELSSLSSGGPCPAWRPYQGRDFGDARSRRAASWHLDFGLPASMAGRMNVYCSKPPRWRRGHGGPGRELPPVIHRLCYGIILTLFFLSWQHSEAAPAHLTCPRGQPLGVPGTLSMLHTPCPPGLALPWASWLLLSLRTLGRSGFLEPTAPTISRWGWLPSATSPSPSLLPAPPQQHCIPRARGGQSRAGPWESCLLQLAPKGRGSVLDCVS